MDGSRIRVRSGVDEQGAGARAHLGPRSAHQLALHGRVYRTVLAARCDDLLCNYSEYATAAIGRFLR
eukprot:1524577-Prymnesium_polylepis.1